MIDRVLEAAFLAGCATALAASVAVIVAGVAARVARQVTGRTILPGCAHALRVLLAAVTLESSER